MKRKSKTKAPQSAPDTVKPPRRKGRRRARRGTLMLIAGLLLSSAMLRVGSQTGRVLALETGAPPLAGAAQGMAEANPPTGDAGCAPPPDLAQMLDSFQAREERLATREAQIRERMNALAIADEEIRKKFDELTQAEAALKATLALADGAAETDLARLTAVYETMKPGDSAALFEQMDPDFAAGFIGRMSPEAAAALMASLTPEKAYTISVILAGRNSSVPKN